MSSEITSIISELKEITNEIKIRALELSKLRKRKEELEEQVVKFLDEKDQPGVKYKGVAVIAEDKIRRLPKKKSQKEEDCLSVLRHYGIGNAEKIYNELLETMKGDEIPKKAIRIKDVKDNSKF
jgi:hypothetical protein